MKLKLFTIGLLAAVAMTSTSIEAMQKKMLQAPQESEHLKKEIGEAAADLGEKPKDLRNLVAPKVDVKAGLDQLHANLGAGGGHPDAHKKVKHLQTLVRPGHDLTDGITRTNSRLGVGYQDAADAGAAIAAAVPPRGRNAVPNNLETALNHNAAKLAGAAHAGHPVPDDSAAKAKNLLARLNAGAHGVGDGNNHAIIYKGDYPSIEAWVTAQGW